MPAGKTKRAREIIKMISFRIYFLLILNGLISSSIYAHYLWPPIDKCLTFTTLVHYNIGCVNSKWSLAIESAWWYSDTYYDTEGYPVYKPLKSYSVGIEGDLLNRKLGFYKMYFQIQRTPYSSFDGAALTGYALGPVIEFSSFAFGIQGSLWANILAGIDLRGRILLDKSILCPSFSPGLYAALPTYCKFLK